MCLICMFRSVRARADWVSDRPGGSGAVRDAIETLLEATGEWTTFVERFTGNGREVS